MKYTSTTISPRFHETFFKKLEYPLLNSNYKHISNDGVWAGGSVVRVGEANYYRVLGMMFGLMEPQFSLGYSRSEPC